MKRRQDSELKLQRQPEWSVGAEFVRTYCIKVTPASLLIVCSKHSATVDMVFSDHGPCLIPV